MPSHPDIERLRKLFPAIREYQALAAEHGVDDIFQDNGGKLLQLALVLGVRLLKSREGNDAEDLETGEELELKTVNIMKTQNFSTHHHMNPVIIAKYRKVPWIFATYEGIELRQIWRLTSVNMEHWFKSWEDKWHRDGGRDINNPKVPLNYVRQHGLHLYTSPDMPHETNVNAALGRPTRRRVPREPGAELILADPPFKSRRRT